MLNMLKKLWNIGNKFSDLPHKKTIAFAIFVALCLPFFVLGKTDMWFREEYAYAFLIITFLVVFRISTWLTPTIKLWIRIPVGIAVATIAAIFMIAVPMQLGLSQQNAAWKAEREKRKVIETKKREAEKVRLAAVEAAKTPEQHEMDKLVSQVRKGELDNEDAEQELARIKKFLDSIWTSEIKIIKQFSEKDYLIEFNRQFAIIRDIYNTWTSSGYAEVILQDIGLTDELVDANGFRTTVPIYIVHDFSHIKTQFNDVEKLKDSIDDNKKAMATAQERIEELRIIIAEQKKANE